MSSPFVSVLRFTKFSLALSHRKWVRAAVVIFVALWLANSAVYLITEAQWFKAIGFASVWRQRLAVQATLFLMGAIGTMIFAAVPIRALTSSLAVQLRAPAEYRRFVTYASLFQQYSKRIAWSVVAVIALLTGLSFAAYPNEYQLFFNSSSYGERDPFFNQNAGFYIFRLPFLKIGLTIMWRAMTALVLLTATLVLGRRAVLLMSPQSHLGAGGTKWLAGLGACWFLLRAAGYYLARFELATVQHVDAVVPAGMTYLDWTIQRPLLWTGVVLCIATALLLLISTTQRKGKFLRGSLVLSAAFALLAPSLIALLILPPLHWLIVVPDAFKVQQRFLEAHISATRDAWNLHNAIQTDVVLSPLAESKIDVSALGGTPVWNTTDLLEAATATQLLPANQQLASNVIDRYGVDGKTKLVAIAVSKTKPNAASDNWINRHVAAPYIYDSGVAVYDPSRSTPNGHPRPLARHGSGSLSQNPFRLTNDKIWYGAQELEYCLSPGRVAGAIALDSFWRRALWAWRLRDINLYLFSSRKTGVTSLLFRRSISERAALLAPFLTPADKLYPVIVDGRVVWMLDLMTATSYYPGALAHSIAVGDGLTSGAIPYNAARDSVKMVMDSIDGRIAFYVAGGKPAADPILQAWRQAFPTLIRPFSEMPPELRLHRRYPRALALAQAQLLARYHAASAPAFYGRVNEWEVLETSGENNEGDKTNATQYLLTPTNRFVLQVPLMAGQQLEVAALLRVECDGDDYGQLRLWRFEDRNRIRQSLQKLTQTPSAKVADQNIEAGTVVPLLIQGEMSSSHLVLLQPFYARAKDERALGTRSTLISAPPKLWRVAIMDAASPREVISVGTGTEEAIADLRRKLLMTGGSTPAALAQQALQAHRTAQMAARRGDWAKAGEWWQRERKLLEQLAAGTGGTNVD